MLRFCQLRLAKGALAVLLAAGLFWAAPLFTAPMGWGTHQASAQALRLIDQPDADAQLFLQADELIYDDASERVTAIGSVSIFYDGYTVNADEVIYDQALGRVLAYGQVVLVDPDGSVLRATFADLSDTLADGFVDALDLETPDSGYFTARSATRRGGTVTEFEDATYTACEACPENPDRPRAWTFHADKITYDEGDQMVYYENARLDFFGIPMVWLPFFAHADPTVDRKTGFLSPNFIVESELGVGLSTPYYIALDPSYDLTLTPTVYTRQGVHVDAAWRQRLDNGEYSVNVSGVYQLDPGAFNGQPGDVAFRGGVESHGSFTLNSRWRTGWNLYWQSDRRYFKDYAIANTGTEVQSDIFLTGLADRSYFDARVQRIEVATLRESNQNQPWTLPSVDYDRRFTPGVIGGEVQLLTNVAVNVREDAFSVTRTVGGTPGVSVFEGLAGQVGRATVDLNWRREFVGPLGQVFTPRLSLRGDFVSYNLGTGSGALFVDTQDAFARAMPTAALEWRWPFLISSYGSSHVVEPVGQFIVRPNATHVGAVPIEDSQSLVFDTSNLFDLDKFSGFDQVEGGTRANVGVRYSGTFNNGISLSAVVGQSFHIAGQNPYAAANGSTPTNSALNLLVPNGVDSGLETNRSDYVASLTASLRNSLSLTASGRFDENNLALRRGEFIASASHGRVSGSATYAYLAAQPNRGMLMDQHQVFGTTSVRVDDNWQVVGSVAYDINQSDVLGVGAGISYVCDCLGIGLNYTYTSAAANGGVADQRFLLSLSMRTIGGVETLQLDSSQFGVFEAPQ